MSIDLTDEYTEKAVAFIDILGFAELITKIGSELQIHRQVRGALAHFIRMRSSSTCSQTAQSDLQITVFSDSIVISAELEHLSSIVWSALHLQAELLGLGILLRGGISRGRLVHQENLIYGEGMIRAYNLESKVACYPRIVMDEELLSLMSEAHKSVFLSEDSDGMWFLDPFTLGIGGVDCDTLLEDGYDPHEESLKMLGLEIDRQLARLTAVAHRVKWTWLKNQHKLAVAQFQAEGSPRFWVFMKDRWPK